MIGKYLKKILTSLLSCIPTPYTLYPILIILLLALTTLHATSVVFITTPNLATPEDDENISQYIFERIYKILKIDFQYQYTTHLEAMQMIDDEADVVIFPYVKPKRMSNRILLSDTLYVNTHRVFFDTEKFPPLDEALYWAEVDPESGFDEDYQYFDFKDLSDLRPYVVGSSGTYKYEPRLRSYGLTILYSKDNLESMKKLIEGEVDFVVESYLMGEKYLISLKKKEVVESRVNSRGIIEINIPDKSADNIRDFHVDVFSEPYFAIAPVKNEQASAVLNRINLLVRDGVVKQIVEDYFKQIWE